MWNQIAAHITQATGQLFTLVQRDSVGGGCINQGAKLSDGERSYFLKLNQASLVDMFAAEALGLEQMAATQTIRVPQPICWGTTDGTAYLVLEWLDLGRGNSATWEALGRNLAALHQVASMHQFGWDRPNTIGATPQPNPWTTNWTSFFTEQRIGYQLHLARRRGGHFPQGDRLLAHIPTLLADHQPQPSLVHGDLWGGNAAVTRSGEPVIFDPATYWGDREVDLAMTELFGGFPPEFYRGYDQVFPRSPGYPQRKILYNLYHILNHFNLFGGSYEGQAQRMIEQLLAA